MIEETLTFDDLTAEEIQESTRKLPVELTVGEKKSKKTFLLQVDNYGLITVRFKEGGPVPPIVKGQFTSMEEAKTAIREWQRKTGLAPVVNEEIVRKQYDGMGAE